MALGSGPALPGRAFNPLRYATGITVGFHPLGRAIKQNRAPEKVCGFFIAFPGICRESRTSD
jgi:hypothetical protein